MNADSKKPPAPGQPQDARQECCNGRQAGEEQSCCGRHGGRGERCCGAPTTTARKAREGRDGERAFGADASVG